MNNLGAFPPMSTAGRTNGLWPGAYAPIPTNKRFCKCAMEKDAVAKYFFTMRLRDLISWLIHGMALSLKRLRSSSARASLCARSAAFS